MHGDHTHAPTCDDIPQTTPLGAHPSYLNGGRLRAWVGFLWTGFERCRQRRALADLDDRLLHDIGITRSEAQREAAKPFWYAGSV